MLFLKNKSGTDRQPSIEGYAAVELPVQWRLAQVEPRMHCSILATDRRHRDCFSSPTMWAGLNKRVYVQFNSNTGDKISAADAAPC